jgi:hypothetical protein
LLDLIAASKLEIVGVHFLHRAPGKQKTPRYRFADTGRLLPLQQNGLTFSEDKICLEVLLKSSFI